MTAVTALTDHADQTGDDVPKRDDEHHDIRPVEDALEEGHSESHSETS